MGCSHHQKIVVIDDEFAVCGGIDMTSDRWDTRAHVHQDPRRKRPNGKPYGPWHDVTMLLEGKAAAALGELARTRWEIAGGNRLDPCPPVTKSAWPERVKAEFSDVTIGIARTRANYEEATEVREIEALFLEMIRRAKHFIYAENQYFTSRKIAEAIALRMAEPNPPEIFIVSPNTADGWLEQKAMDGQRARLLRAIGKKDVHKRFNIYVAHTSGGTPIYTHAKLMIVDDVILRVGSANMNNRSLGLDSECDVFIDSTMAENMKAARAIRDLRISLLAEHCAVSSEEVIEKLSATGSMRALADSFPAQLRRLVRLELPDLTEAEKLIADNAALDPENPDEMLEPFSSPGLFARSRWLKAPD
jgi:phosphatidylserine/phosphatidylglycerophosphate/cardiolipin synthase-like enzyme